MTAVPPIEIAECLRGLVLRIRILQKKHDAELSDKAKYLLACCERAAEHDAIEQAAGIR